MPYSVAARKTWMAGTSPAMTWRVGTPSDRFFSRSVAPSPLAMRFPHLRLDLRNAADPAIVILGLLAHVVDYLQMRQDQKRFLLDALERVLRDLKRAQVTVAGLRTFRDRAQHVGVDALRAKDRDFDAVGAVRDCQVFGKANRGVFGGRIGRTADLREKSGSGNGVEKITTAARLHPRHQMTRGVDMRHDVDRPALRPRLVRMAAGVFRERIEAAADAGIGAEQIDRTEAALGFVDQAQDVV